MFPFDGANEEAWATLGRGAVVLLLVFFLTLFGVGELAHLVPVGCAVYMAVKFIQAFGGGS